MSEIVERMAKAIEDKVDELSSGDCTFNYVRPSGLLASVEIARAVIEAMRELPEEPGPRYSAGEYSRRNQQAMIDDALEPAKVTSQAQF